MIITGLSGSGKTYALHTFEDIGYYCIDNLPVELIPTFLNLIDRSRAGIKKIAIICDIREKRFLKNFETTFEELKEEKLDISLLFLEASNEALMRRYSETRRPHPLRDESILSSMIEKERKMLASIRSIADHVIDTSDFNVHQLKSYILQNFSPEEMKQDALAVNVLSFGFKHGLPQDMDILFDVRFLPNPYFNEELKDMSGLENPVQKFVKSTGEFTEFFPRLKDILLFLLPKYKEEGKYYLNIAFGCTGGKHRSVTVAEEVYKVLKKAGFKVLVEHRDIHLSN